MVSGGKTTRLGGGLVRLDIGKLKLYIPCMNYQEQIKRWGKETARRKALRRAKGRIADWVPYRAAVPSTNPVNVGKNLEKKISFINKLFRRKTQGAS